MPAGWTIATLLPLLNTSAAPGLERWDPDRWHRHRLAEQERAAVADAGDGVRARAAFLPGPAVLAGGDDVGDDAICSATTG